METNGFLQNTPQLPILLEESNLETGAHEILSVIRPHWIKNSANLKSKVKYKYYFLYMSAGLNISFYYHATALDVYLSDILQTLQVKMPVVDAPEDKALSIIFR